MTKMWFVLNLALVFELLQFIHVAYDYRIVNQSGTWIQPILYLNATWLGCSTRAGILCSGGNLTGSSVVIAKILIMRERYTV